MQRSSLGLLNVAQMFSSQVIRFKLCLMHGRHPNLASPRGRAAISWCPPSMWSPGGLSYLWDVNPAERAGVFTCYSLPLHKLSKTCMCRVKVFSSALLFHYILQTLKDLMYITEKMPCFGRLLLKMQQQDKHHYLSTLCFLLFLSVRSHSGKGLLNAHTQITVPALVLSQQIDCFIFIFLHTLTHWVLRQAFAFKSGSILK